MSFCTDHSSVIYNFSFYFCIIGLSLGILLRKNTGTPNKKATLDCTNNWNLTSFVEWKKTWRNLFLPKYLTLHYIPDSYFIFLLLHFRWSKSFGWTCRHFKNNITNGFWRKTMQPCERVTKGPPALLSTSWWNWKSAAITPFWQSLKRMRVVMGPVSSYRLVYWIKSSVQQLISFFPFFSNWFGALANWCF